MYVCMYSSTHAAFPDQHDEQIRVHISDPHGSTKNNAVSDSKFKFERVYAPSASQSEVFEDVEPFVSSCLDGYNVCVFAYGQTGSGKTYSMEGNAENPGINYRCLQELFAALQDKKTATKANYQVTMSVVEVYNEKVRDLLVKSRTADNGNLQIKTDADGKMFIPGLNTENVDSTAQVCMCMCMCMCVCRQSVSKCMYACMHGSFHHRLSAFLSLRRSAS
jgi:hypothetical protein